MQIVSLASSYREGARGFQWGCKKESSTKVNEVAVQFRVVEKLRKFEKVAISEAFRSQANFETTFRRPKLQKLVLVDA